MVHRCCTKQKVKRGLWSPEEDEKLTRHIVTYGHASWSSVPKLAGLQRCGKSCRLRWINYLRPDLKRGTFTSEEEQIIIDVHRILGNRWAQIAKHLPGRTDNEVKNFWNSCIKKKLISQGLDPKTHNLIPPHKRAPNTMTCNKNNDNNNNINNSSSQNDNSQENQKPFSIFTSNSHVKSKKHSSNRIEIANVSPIFTLPIPSPSHPLPHLFDDHYSINIDNEFQNSTYPNFHDNFHVSSSKCVSISSSVENIGPSCLSSNVFDESHTNIWSDHNYNVIVDHQTCLETTKKMSMELDIDQQDNQIDKTLSEMEMGCKNIEPYHNIIDGVSFDFNSTFDIDYAGMMNDLSSIDGFAWNL